MRILVATVHRPLQLGCHGVWLGPGLDPGQPGAGGCVAALTRGAVPGIEGGPEDSADGDQDQQSGHRDGADAHLPDRQIVDDINRSLGGVDGRKRPADQVPARSGLDGDILEQLSQLPGRLNTVVHSLGQGLADGLLQLIGDLHGQAHGGRCGREVLLHDLEVRLAVKGRPAGHGFIEGDSQRVEIRAVVHLLAADLLRRHVAHGAHGQPGLGQLG